MKNKLLLMLVGLMAAIGWATAQNTIVSGVIVSAEDNEPIIGASVLVTGTSLGTVTDLDGKFTITDVPGTAKTIRASYMGMETQEVTITPGTMRIMLKSDAKLLDEVVVTALGIVKKEKSLTYSTQMVGGDELVRAKDPNMMNALAGKAAGVQINKSSSGLGGSTKVIIRGNRSVSGNNQPLYVIDGVPYGSNVSETVCTIMGGTSNDGNLDKGDGISNLNPDDIESMNILKGPAAAALYGSSAANGVIIITTRKGKEGRASITFNTSTTFDTPTFGIPELQNTYTGATKSWGEKLQPGTPSPDYVDDFLGTGVTTVNSLSLSMGSEAMQTYFSYANTYGKGAVENNSLVKHNLNFRETANFLNKKLTIDANINATFQKAKNRTASGGYYMNPLVGLYRFPRGGVNGGKDGLTFDYYKNNYQVLDPGRNLMTQNWYAMNDLEQNPYWLLHKTSNGDERYRAVFNLTMKYKFNDLFTLQVRGNADLINDRDFVKMYAGTAPVLAGRTGSYASHESTGLTTYADILFTYQQQFEKFSVSASVGSSVNDYYGKGTGFNAGSGGNLFIPNVFSMQNIRLNQGLLSDWQTHSQTQSVFFTGQVGFLDQVYLDVTARNDWTSSLAFTKYMNKGFFYPSVGLTWVINETLKLPQWISLGKIRGAWSQVGNGLGNYTSNPRNSMSSTGDVAFNVTAPFGELKPESTNSIEFGTEWRFFDSRLEFDFTYYKTNTRNQLFNLPAPSGSKWNNYFVNAGNIENTGIEVMLSGTPVLTEAFRWKTGFNYSHNRNKAIELAEGLGYFGFGGNDNFQNRLEVGGSFGDFYGSSFARDEKGKIKYDEQTGLPIIDKSMKKLGNPTPDFNLGWNNTLTYKDFTLYFLIDARFGGEVTSITQADLDAQGVSKATGQARQAGYVMLEGQKIEGEIVTEKGDKMSRIQSFYELVGNRNGCTEYYVSDATNIRLRELSISYALPKSWLAKTNVIKDAMISLTGRNLFFFKNNASYDPDGMMSTSSNMQGVDAFGMPTNRSFGINVKLNF